MKFPEPTRSGYSWICFRVLPHYYFPDVNAFDDDQWFSARAVAYSAHLLYDQGLRMILWFMLVDDLDIADFTITCNHFTSDKLYEIAKANHINPASHASVCYKNTQN